MACVASACRRAARGGRVEEFAAAGPAARRALPVLVYEPSTEDTVNSIESLLRGLADRLLEYIDA